MEEDPYAIVEAMTIEGFATGSERGLLYLRAEYPLSAARMAHAIANARAAGYLGDDVLGAGFSFDIEIVRGAGAYICGEETALFNSIEGRRGEPRNKPPFPVEVGLFGKPTAVNNIETLVNVPAIVAGGGAAFAAIGTQGSTGTQALLPVGCGRAAGRLRGRVRGDARRPAGPGRGCPRRAGPQGDPARRGRRRVRRTRRAGSPAHLRGHAGGRDDPRLRGRPGVRRDGRPGRCAPADRRLLPRRVVRPVRPVPHRDGAPGGAAGAPRGRAAAGDAGR